MSAVAHNPAFAKKVGIAQKVGRDFVAADKAAGLFKAKEPTMRKRESSGLKHHTHSESGHKHAEAYGHEQPGNANGIRQRKNMAMGEGGTFGAEPFHEMNDGTGIHPDHAAHTGRAPELMDHERGTPPAIHHTKGHHPAQAAPHHGPTHPGGHGEHHSYETEV